MSKYPYMPFYTQSYEVDTLSLTMEESGCYIQLLLKMWQANGSLPLDIFILGSICRMSKTKFTKVWYKIEHYFLIENGRIYSEKLTKELEKNKDISQKNSENVKKKYEKSLENSKENYNNLSAKSLIDNDLVYTVVKPIEESIIEYINIKDNILTDIKEKQDLSCSENQDNCLEKQNVSIEKNELVLTEKPVKAKTTQKKNSRLAIAENSDINGLPFPVASIADYFIDYSMKNGLNFEERTQELRKFTDFHLKKGSLFADWQAACRTWIANSLKFNQNTKIQKDYKIGLSTREISKNLIKKWENEDLEYAANFARNDSNNGYRGSFEGSRGELWAEKRQDFTGETIDATSD